MTENQFIKELEFALNGLPAEERNDIVQDIREYFANGRADGKAESEIAAELGDPAVIAKELTDSFDFSKAETPALNFDLTKDDYDQVNIDIENAKLSISSSADGETHVDISGKNPKQELSVKVVDRTLVISLTEESIFWGIFSIRGSLKSPVLNVQLPDRLYKKIRINCDHDSVTGTNLSSSEFRVETENGRIDFSRIGAGSFTAYSDNGDVRLSSVQAKTIKAEAENGAIVLKEVEGDVLAVTDNGRIHLLAADLDRNIKLETDNGAILVETHTQPKNARIRAEVDWGSVSVFGSKNRETTFGSGQHPVDLYSDNGSITVKLVNS